MQELFLEKFKSLNYVTAWSIVMCSWTYLCEHLFDYYSCEDTIQIDLEIDLEIPLMPSSHYALGIKRWESSMTSGHKSIIT